MGERATKRDNDGRARPLTATTASSSLAQVALVVANRLRTKLDLDHARQVIDVDAGERERRRRPRRGSVPAQPGSRASIKPRASCVRSVTASQGFEQSSWRLTCGDLVARVPPREREREGERERVSKRASEQAAERASERASERDRVAQGRWSESGTLSRRAAAAGLAPDVKFSCGKAQLYFTV